MAHADEVAALAKLVENGRDVRALQVDPTDDSSHEVALFGEREEASRLLEARVGLHDDDTFDVVRGQARPQVFGAERPVQNGHAVGHPVEAPVPEVDVRVDHESSSQSSAGIVTPSRSRHWSSSAGERGPTRTLVTAGCLSGNWRAAAASGTP